MKKIIDNCFIVVFLFFAITARAYAQDYSKMNLHFVYIDHEPSTPVNRLCERIRTLRDDAIEVDDALIIYLADGHQSLLSFTNLGDKSKKGRDKNDAFINIIAALQDAISHDVIAKDDRKNILKLFDEYNFVDNTGKFLFNTLTMDFYVGADFWTLGNNEKVIARLFSVLDASSFSKEQFVFNVFKPKGEKLNYPEGLPFGDNNIDEINSKLSIFEY